VLYLDSSALVRLVVAEAETKALTAYLRRHRSEPVVTSALARVEVVRAARLVDTALVANAQALMRRTDQVPVSPDLLTEAAHLGPERLRTLDAIHVASALRIQRAGLTALVTYDQRMRDAAAAVGLPTTAPR
jgi:uncharacterized protein